MERSHEMSQESVTKYLSGSLKQLKEAKGIKGNKAKNQQKSDLTVVGQEQQSHRAVCRKPD